MFARVRFSQLRLLCVAVAVTLVPVAASANSDEPSAAWVPGQFLVGLHEGVNPAVVAQAAHSLGGEVISEPSIDHFERVCGPITSFGALRLVQLPDGTDTAAAQRVLGSLPGVDFVQRNHRVVTTGPTQDSVPPKESPQVSSGSDFASDPLVPGQWALRNDGRRMGTSSHGSDSRAGWDIDGLEAWDLGATGQGQVIAILDDGMEVTHEDLRANLWTNAGEVAGNGIDDDGNGWVDDIHGWRVGAETGQITPGWHGTNVAGLAAARGGNGIGVSGVAPLAQLMPVQFIGALTDKSSTEIWALGAFAYAIANGADVINNSWGFYAPVALGSPVMTRAVECAAEKDILLVWAGGNAYAVPDSHPAYYPAPNVLVASLFNNKGCPGAQHQWNAATIDVLAPGAWNMSTSLDDDYGYFAMSSAASPHVAGVAALVRQMRPELSAEEVARAIRNGARADFIEPWSQSMGYLNAVGALSARADVDVLMPPLGDDPMQSSVVRCAYMGHW